MSLLSEQLEQVSQARISLQKVRSKLLRPSAAALDSGAGELTVALECMQRLEPMLAARDRSGVGAEQTLRLEMAGLRRELQHVNALLESAGKFYEGWARLLSSAKDDAAVNYTALGQPCRTASNESGKLVIHG